VVAFVLQYMFVRDELKPTHAGGAVYRLGRDTVEYLLVGPKRDTEKTEWVLPKGHIEKSDKTIEQAAVREVEEEAGVEAVPIAPLDSVSFCFQGKTIRVVFYLMRQSKSGNKAGDGRRQEWFPFNEAVRKATHATTREVLREAEIKRRCIEKNLEAV
jgi:8-oxo-dGTP pyrophosphatase MutT (NUDIX family)